LLTLVNLIAFKFYPKLKLLLQCHQRNRIYHMEYLGSTNQGPALGRLRVKLLLDRRFFAQIT